MKISRIREFKKTKTIEVTINLSKKDCESLSHAICCTTCMHPEVYRKGKDILRELEVKVFYKHWER